MKPSTKRTTGQSFSELPSHFLWVRLTAGPSRTSFSYLRSFHGPHVMLCIGNFVYIFVGALFFQPWETANRSATN